MRNMADKQQGSSRNLVLTCAEYAPHNKVWLIHGEDYVCLTLRWCRMTQRGLRVEWEVIGENVTLQQVEGVLPTVQIILPTGEMVTVEFRHLSADFQGRFCFMGPETVQIWRHVLVLKGGKVPKRLLNS